MAVSDHWDWRAIRAGGSVALVFAVPLSIAARILSDRADDDGTGSSGIASLLALGALFGFFIGAGVAAWHQRRGTPLTHGMVTAAGTFIVAQTFFVLIRLVLGGQIRWLAIVFNLTLTLAVGALGGVLGSLMQRHGLAPRR